MPVQECMEDGKHGMRWGKAGKCYTYSNEKEKKLARLKAQRQGRRIEMSIAERRNS